MNKTIYLFCYNFPHRKSQDFLLTLLSHGLKKIVVIAAPKVELALSKSPISILNNLPPVIDTKTLCANLNVPFYVVDHNDTSAIQNITAKYGRGLGVIGGARIISRNTLEIFTDGIINFHPGPLPETSGLDSFYWMLLKSVEPAIPAHFIDYKVDSGDLIVNQKPKLCNEDSPSSVLFHIYNAQLSALHKILNDFHLLENPRPICRPSKNRPLSFEEKVNALSKFEDWKSKYLDK